MSKKLSPYQRIVRNAEKDRGVVLSRDEVHQLAGDSAIYQVADDDDAISEGEDSTDEGREQ